MSEEPKGIGPYALMMDDVEARFLRLILHAGRMAMFEHEEERLKRGESIDANQKLYVVTAIEYVESVIRDIDANIGRIPWPDEKEMDDAVAARRPDQPGRP